MPAPASPFPDASAPEAHTGWLAEASPDAMMLTDVDGVIRYVNPAFEAMTGYAREEALGRTPALLRSGRMSEAFYAQLWATLKAGRPFRGVLLNRRRSGELFHEEKLIRPLCDARGRVTHFLACGRDVSERMAAIARLTLAATHDGLTGLPNRAVFLDRLEQALARARRSGGAFAVALLDVDRFKAVNDTLGHAAGDALLRSVARRLLACVRHSDTVARLGGDEFALLFEGADDERDLNHALHGIVQAFADPVPLAEGRLCVSLSVGACVAGPGDDAPALLRRADEAMYRAKRRGGNGFQLHGAPEAPVPARRDSVPVLLRHEAAPTAPLPPAGSAAAPRLSP